MRLILSTPAMPPRYSTRSRNYCYSFVVFQVIFVAIQVFIFYPCWQRAPESTILRSFRSNQQQPQQVLPHLEPNKGIIEKTGDAVHNVVNKGMDYMKNAPLGVQRQEPPIPQEQQQQQQQQQQIQQPQQQQQPLQPQQQAQPGQVYQQGNFGARENGQNLQDIAKEKMGNVFNYVQNKMGLNAQQSQQLAPIANANGDQGVQEQQPQQQQQQQLQQHQQEGAQLRSQQEKMLQQEQQKAVEQNQLASKILYNTSWASLDSRPNPQWYDSAKIGIFIHWGVFSVPSYSVSNGLAEWFWFYWKSDHFLRPVSEEGLHKFQRFLAKKSDAIKGVKEYAEKMYPPTWRYTDFATEFKAEMFDAKHWAKVFQESGAKYVILTSKHHDGFTLWPSRKSWNWNAKDVGPHRDLVGELGKAVKEQGLRYGLYHSLYEWFNPMYEEDKRNNFATQTFVKEKMMPELKELVTTYRPDIVWSDGQFEAPCSYWNCTEFLAWLYNESPVRDTVVTNDRWGTDVLCKHGGYLTCHDRYNPGSMQSKKWENCMTIDRESWGYRRNAVLADYYSMEALLELLAQTVSYGGNLLMNIGPTADGRIPPIFEERLKQLGAWLQVNGEAIYLTSAWTTQVDPNNKHVYYTTKSTADGPAVFAIVLSWPEDDILRLAAPQPSSKTRAMWLGYHEDLTWQRDQSGGMSLTLPKVSVKQIPCQWAWVFKLTALLNAVPA